MSPSGNIEELAYRQGLGAEVRRRLRGTAPGPVPAEGPWITVSRQAGSHGSELATAIAETLGWKAYDREILSAIASETFSDEVVLSRLDEHGVREFDEYLVGIIVPEDPGQARYLVGLARVIAKLARQGRVVLVGRGAGWLLTPSCGLRVRVIGPLEARAEEIGRLHSVSVDEARRRVSENDDAQRGFVRQAFQRDIDDPAGYDLFLNVAELGFDAAREAVLAGAKAKLKL
jgi:cytidylate kinase